MGKWCRYSSRFCQEASGCSGCEIYLNRNTGLAGADNRGSIPQKSIAKAGFFQYRLSPIINPHPAFANSSSAVGKIGRSRRPHKPEIAGSNPACAFPVQVERSEQDAGTFYFNPHSSTINIKSPCNPYVEKAGLIFCTNHHHTTAFSFTHCDYLLADSAALNSGTSYNSAVTPDLCRKERKEAWAFAIFPHAAPIYYDFLRRCSIGLVPALPSSHSSRPEADWVHSIDGRLPDNYYSHENDMSCMVIKTKSPCSDLIKVG